MKMAASRTVHGLAGLIDSDDSGSDSDDSGKSAQRQEGKSVFDVPSIFNKDVTLKLREGERIQLEMAAKEPVEVIDVTKSPVGTDDDDGRSPPRKQRRLTASGRSSCASRRSYVHILADTDSECSENDSSCDTGLDAPRASEASFIDLDISHRTEPDDEADEVIYRVVVTQIGDDDARVIVRLTEKDTMNKVFTEAAILAGKGGILMMGTDEERREVLPEDTVKSLGLPTVGLARMEFVPISGNGDVNDTLPPGFTIKIITGNRRETKEVRCKPDEPLGGIFRRYCSMAGVRRNDVIFKFDDEEVENDATPAELGIDSGDIIEAHLQNEHITPSGVLIPLTDVDADPKTQRRRSCRAT